MSLWGVWWWEKGAFLCFSAQPLQTKFALGLSVAEEEPTLETALPKTRPRETDWHWNRFYAWNMLMSCRLS